MPLKASFRTEQALGLRIQLILGIRINPNCTWGRASEHPPPLNNVSNGGGCNLQYMDLHAITTRDMV